MSPSPSSLAPVAVLGAGRIGTTIAKDLLDHGVERILLIDSHQGRLDALTASLASDAVTPIVADISDPGKMGEHFASVRTVVSAVPYRLNVPLAREAVRRGANWIDLGGNTEVVEEILSLDGQAREKGVTVIPDAGLQPGLGNILAGEIDRRLGGAESLRVLVGGLPQHPEGVLKYQLVFSIEGLLNEYHGEVRTLDKGELRIREPLSGVEPFPWEGMPDLECFHTSGSASTLPGSYLGRAQRVEVKTVRYAGHAAALTEIFQRVPRDERAAYIESTVPSAGDDLVVMRVEGARGDSYLAFELEDRFDPVSGHSAMMRTTGYPAAILVLLGLAGELPHGALIQERDIPAPRVIEELANRGLVLTTRTAPVGTAVAPR